VKKTYKKIEEKLTSEGTELRQPVAELEAPATDHMQTEQLLRKTEGDKLAILNSISEHVVYQDTEHRILWTNRAAAESVGSTAAQLVGRHCYEIWPQRSQPCAGCPVAKARQSGKPQKAEIATPDGRTWSIRGYPMRDENGVITGMLEVALDLTERKQAEEALQAERNKLQSVIGAMEYDLTIQDKDYNVIYQNEPSRASSGGDRVGEKCYRVYEGRDRICDGCPVKKAFKDGKSHTVERKRVMPSGEVAFYENTANPVRDASGEIVACLEIGRNVTERKQAEQALADEATRRRILVDQSLDGIVVLDENSKVYEANQKFAEMLGYTSEEVRELHTWDWDKNFPPEKLLEMGRNVDEKGLRLETKHHRKDGSVIDVDISINGAVIAGQKLIFCACRDITERKKREQLQKAENYVLTLLGQGANLSELLDAIVRLGEQNDPSIKGSALLFDPSKSKELLFQASAPSLPDDYQELFANGIPIGPKSGSCGTAAHRKERVIVPDIASSPLFKPTEEVIKRAVNNGLLAVWSQPIIASNGDLLGTIANYSNKVGEPSAGDLRVLEWSARIAAFAIERKKAEQALQESNQRFTDIAENALEWIWEVDTKGKYTYASPIVEQIVGYKPEEVVEKHFYDLFHPDDREELKKAAFKAFAAKQPFRQFLNRNIHKNGEIVWLSTSGVPILDKEGNLLGFRGADVDITERKKAEEALRESEESTGR